MTDSPPELQHPLLVKLYNYWNERRRGREMPARGDLDPLDFAYLLGSILLVDVLHDPLRFRVRLHGVNMAERAGYDLTGRLVDEIPDPEFREASLVSFSHVVAKRQPRCWRRNRLLDDRWMHYETLMLPLSSDGRRIDMLLIGLVYLDR